MLKTVLLFLALAWLPTAQTGRGAVVIGDPPNFTVPTPTIPQSLTYTTPTGTLTRVEKLTPDEQKTMQDAAEKLEVARKIYEATKAKVAAQHQMVESSYMESSEWYEIQDTFILQYLVVYPSSITWGNLPFHPTSR